jgi:Domain of unknown function (DUF5134)
MHAMKLHGTAMRGGAGDAQRVHHGAPHPTVGMAMGHAGPGAHAALNLRPEWIGIVGVVLLLLVAGSHARHLVMTSGERRPWHLCHVLMAIGMAFMYVPATLDPHGVPPLFWQSLFAAAAIAAGVRGLAGLTGHASSNPLWLLTGIDLGAMVYMWSTGSLVPALTWMLVAYLVVEAALWAVNAYRVIDGGPPLISWGALAPATGGGVVFVSESATSSLIGDLDISVSMTTMALGMAYMFAAMQLMM